ncbi:DNA-3-methyladenine glycosylase [Planctomycetes bacterium K23_9]|uniref:DNA-3-methyladenine glycosylase II n=2 Tax=Stieleria marina TaxID=1930275 RepID=A0A517NZC8_9BACT|nr:DNA-3-methyladenine glycosylase [Planctomycetes bacterium K23_9]
MSRAVKKLARIDPVLRTVLKTYGPPPLWKRPATFATFVRIILEQQVSLASAKSTFDKLRQSCGGSVTALRVQQVGDDGLREIGFSRQKARYTIRLADDVRCRRFQIGSLHQKSNDEARDLITARLGLGNWSADVFLMMALMRPDVFPVGDLALIKGMASLDGGDYTSPEKAIARGESWRPFRSVATRMVWHWYLKGTR